MSYEQFILSKSQSGADSGFAPLWMPDFLFPFQAVKNVQMAASGRRDMETSEALKFDAEDDFATDQEPAESTTEE